MPQPQRTGWLSPDFEPRERFIGIWGTVDVTRELWTIYETPHMNAVI